MGSHKALKRKHGHILRKMARLYDGLAYTDNFGITYGFPVWARSHTSEFNLSLSASNLVVAIRSYHQHNLDVIYLASGFDWLFLSGKPGSQDGKLTVWK